jgi:transposase
MSVPIPVPKAQAIIQQHQAGMSLPTIAQHLHLSVWTVRDIGRRFRDRGSVQPNYAACGRRGPRVERRVYRGAMWLKRTHPAWAATLIRTVLKQKGPEAHLPQARTLQRWFRQAGINRPRQGQQHQGRVKRGGETHAVWEMDSKVRMRLASGEQVQGLLISDEYSGAILYESVFPL